MQPFYKLLNLLLSYSVVEILVLEESRNAERAEFVLSRRLCSKQVLFPLLT